MSVQVGADIQTLKEQVATCCRLLYMEGIFNYSGHVSARIPGTDYVLIQPLFESRAAVRAEDILTVDLDATLVEGKARPPHETRLHTEVYRARPDVQAVAHLHSEVATLFTMTDAQLVPMKNHAARWASGIPTHPDPARIITAEQGRAVAQTLSHHNAVLLRAHGALLVAESVQTLFMDAIHFEENARAQLTASQLGRLKPLTEEELARLSTEWVRADHAAKLWHHYLRKAEAAGLF